MDTDTTIILDEISMKYILLNVLTLDPIHDFSTLNQISKGKSDNDPHRDVRKSLDDLVEYLDWKIYKNDDTPRITYGGGNELQLQNLNEQQLIEYSKTTVNNFVSDFTNYIFSDSLLSCLDIKEQFEETKKLPDSLHDLQTLIIQPAIKNLEDSQYSYIGVVKDIYTPRIKPLLEKAILDSDIVETINQAENEIKEELYKLVLSDKQPLLFDINKVIQDVNAHISNEKDKIQITENEIQNPISLENKINKIRRQLALKFHPDKNIHEDTTAIFTEINGNILDIINCIQDTTCLQQLNKTTPTLGKRRMDEEQSDSNIKRAKFVGGRGIDSGSVSEGGKIFFKHLLGYNVMNFLKYVDAIEYNKNGRVSGPKFIPVPNLDDINNLQNWKYYLYNTQLFMIWVNYIWLKKLGTPNDLTQEKLETMCPDKNSYSNYKRRFFGPFISWNDDAGVCKIEFNGGKIEQSTYDMFEKLITERLRHNIFLHASGIDELEEDEFTESLIKKIGSEKKFVINNSAKTPEIKNVYYDSYKHNEWLKDNEFCPIPSIIDGMALCKYSTDEKEVRGGYMHNSKLHIQEENGEFSYNVDFTLDPENPENIVFMEAVFTKFGDVKGPIRIEEKLNYNANNKKTQLNAPNTLRNLIEHMLKQYKKVSQQISTRKKNTQVYEHFFDVLGKGMIERLLIKSIGDWSQEMYTVTKKPNNTDSLIRSPTEVHERNSNFNQFLIGITEDRLSACRMLFLQIFGKNTNDLSIAGAYSKNFKLLYGNKNSILKEFEELPQPKQPSDDTTSTQSVAKIPTPSVKNENERERTKREIREYVEKNNSEHLAFRENLRIESLAKQEAAKEREEEANQAIETQRQNRISYEQRLREQKRLIKEKRKSLKIKRKLENREHNKTQRNISENEQDRVALIRRERQKYLDRRFLRTTKKAEQKNNDKNVINKSSVYDMDIDGGKSTKKKRRNHKRNTKRANKRK